MVDVLTLQCQHLEGRGRGTRSSRSSYLAQLKPVYAIVNPVWVGERWWLMLLRLLAGKCIYMLLAIVYHSLSKQSIIQLCIVTTLIHFLNNVLYGGVCCVDLNVQLTFVLQTCSEQTLTIYRPLEKWGSVQSGLELWSFYLFLPVAGIKEVCYHALSFGVSLFCYWGDRKSVV